MEEPRRSVDGGLLLQARLPRVPGGLAGDRPAGDVPERTLERGPVQRRPGDGIHTGDGFHVRVRPERGLLLLPREQPEPDLEAHRELHRLSPENDLGPRQPVVELVLVRVIF